MMSDVFWVSLALVLVLEGFFPAVSPNLYRRMVQLMSEKDDAGLRRIGLVMMGLGAVIIYFVKP
jgi:uncharacterized protein YjeT (DUF2065 family)